MKQAFFLGIDNGGTASKAAVFDASGKELSVASRRVNILSPRTGWSERDMNLLWTDTAAVIREAIQQADIAPEHILGVACTGHGNGLYLLDRNGKPLRNGINSNDERAQSYIDRWRRNRIDETVLPMTAQSIWAAQPAPLLAWIRDNEPDVFRNIGSVLMVKDFIRYCLTGECRTEITDMSGSGLMNVVECKYDLAVLKSYGLTEIATFLQQWIESTEIGGYVTAEAAALTGLKEGTPVAGGMFDIDACALSSGILDSGEFSIVAGTWGNNQYIARQPLVDKDLFMTSCYAIPDWYLMLEGSPTSAGNLEWLLETFFAREKKEEGVNFYSRISEMVSAVEPTASQVIFLPFLYGCNSGSLKGGFFGLDASCGQGELLRAVFEGVVFAHYQHIERLLKFRDFPKVIRLTGGAARSPVWIQIFADCIGVPVEAPSGSELGALGAAMAAAVAANYYADLPEAVSAMTSIAARYEPNPAYAPAYREKYAAYRNLIQKLNLLNS
ncbi:MAG: carbohydrate kinase [Prevotellaceae bacterium]|jgi:L-xylulokinase|nr:carbohydrate kinase [Prevotellaceae bacterium]